MKEFLTKTILLLEREEYENIGELSLAQVRTYFQKFRYETKDTRIFCNVYHETGKKFLTIIFYIQDVRYYKHYWTHGCRSYSGVIKKYKTLLSYKYVVNLDKRKVKKEKSNKYFDKIVLLIMKRLRKNDFE